MVKKNIIGLILVTIILSGFTIINKVNLKPDDVEFNARLMAYSVVWARNNIGEINGTLSDMEVMTNTRNNLIFLRESEKYCSDKYKDELDELILANESVIKKETNSLERFSNAMKEIDIVMKEISDENDLIDNEKNRKAQYKKSDNYASKIMK